MFAVDFAYFLFGIIAFVCLPFIWWYLCMTKYKSLDKVPGPKPLPVIGNVTHVKKSPCGKFK